MVETIKGYLEKNGIKINIIIQEWGTYMRAFKAGKYDLVLGQWIGFTGPDMLKVVFHSNSVPPHGLNRGYYVNKKLDMLIDKASVELDSAKRTNLFKTVQFEALNKDYAYINLWHANIIWIGRPCLTGIDLHPNGSFYPLMKIKNNCH